MGQKLKFEILIKSQLKLFLAKLRKEWKRMAFFNKEVCGSKSLSRQI